MQYSRNQLTKLRSGQMVWRVLLLVSEGPLGPVIKPTITPTWVLGKKILHWFRDLETKKPQWSSMTVRANKAKYNFAYDMDVPNPMSTAHFLADLHGDGAFSSKRHAERYVAEVMAGQHPDVVERLMRNHEDDKMFDRMMEYQYEEMYYDEYGDQGE